jgi:hypothetical protein
LISFLNSILDFKDEKTDMDTLIHTKQKLDIIEIIQSIADFKRYDMKLKKLPIGIQTFKDIREEDYLYIDKTLDAYKLINTYKYAFLSRPRRFGKSLFLDTLRNIFEGKKELFEGLYIYDKWDWDVKYPVIKISWDGKNRSLEDLKDKTAKFFLDNQRKLGIECESENHVICFEELIQKTSQKYNQKVVILIDEYDKPILDVIEDIEQAKEHREFIKGLYSVIKGCDEYVKFAFLTGVSKFSKSSIFSGLNMLTDISLTPKYGNICGYTQKDIESTFKPYLDGVDMERFKNFYNGYNFLKDPVYNPFDTLLFISQDFKYSNYWFATGTPTFLIKLIQKNNYFIPNLSNLVVDEKLLDSFDVENIDLEVILYQSGYLTIDKMIEKRNRIEYRLKIPNEEVRSSFNDIVIDYLTNQKVEKLHHQDKLYDTLAEGNLEEFKNSLIALFASIPYNNYVKNTIPSYEGYYASVIYTYLSSLGITIIAEDVTNKGRIDLTLFIEDKIYILEFKVDGEKGEALKQIEEKNYAQKYLNQSIEIYLVGIEFDSEEKNLSHFEWKKNY